MDNYFFEYPVVRRVIAAALFILAFSILSSPGSERSKRQDELAS